ncbi:hypothetical protein A1O3_02954 [Capronia epimyces CBS 606.96]|uniref:Uncharacterized protein n=1 Tax=Capronia epimyces CBS 606.96 TaxID=1182542 RepID=W9YAN6_9EURO|nr:uncharacterized protein A1O3_02954 [Capronia epimyces CBS 606.96]EXJ89887.1 hypothetical protein A1O3_02954 [Capronia epimyces CBS 606.96]
MGEPSEDEPDFPYADNVPSKDDKVFTSWIHRDASFEPFAPKDGHFSAWDDAPNPKTYASFGDQGVTASVNAYGHLLMFGRYLSVGTSGMFMTDQTNVPQPWYVMWRSLELQDISAEQNGKNMSYGLRFEDATSDNATSDDATSEDATSDDATSDDATSDDATSDDATSDDATSDDATSDDAAAFDDQLRSSYVHDRWPRYEYTTEANNHITIQWIVHQEAVLQQVVITNFADNNTKVKFSFGDGMHLRDMDHHNYRPFEGPDNSADPSTCAGPNGYGCVYVRPLPQDDEEDDEDNYKEGGKEDNGAPVDSEQKPDSVTTIVSVFIDGEAKTGVGKDTWIHELRGKKAITLAQETPLSDTVEVVVAYKMLFLPKSKGDWSDFLIPARSTNVNTLLRNEPFTELNLSGVDMSPPSHDDTTQKAVAPKSTQTGDTSKDPKKDAAKAKKLQEPQNPENPLNAQKPPNLGRPPNPQGIPDKSASSHIEYAVRRNLEHILSGCAVPLRKPLLKGAEPTEKWPDGIVPVALTCGDMSTHRVCTSASFFAFQFLIQVAKRLNRLEQDDYVKSLRQRIDDVCRGHLAWLRRVWELNYQPKKQANVSESRTSKTRCFVANYWVTGRSITPSNESALWSPSWMPEDSLTDTPYQVIKVAEFAALYREPSDQDLAKKIMVRVGQKWCKELFKLDKRGELVWPHARDEDITTFRLDDHVLIWKAIKSMQDLDIWVELRKEKKNKEDDSKEDGSEDGGFDELAKRFTRSDIQRVILGHFTTLNDHSGKRMVAVKRSARETRFMLHARDTVLFYAIDWGLSLEQTSFREVWTNTIESQIHHDENQEAHWDNAIRYALAIVMASQDKTINKHTPSELLKLSLQVLFQSTSPNAFFPGQLDKNTKEPELYRDEEDRDWYFHASFEIPFVLLLHAGKINSIFDGQHQKQPQKNPVPDIEQPRPGMEQVAERFTAEPKNQTPGSNMGSDHALALSDRNPEKLGLWELLPGSRKVMTKNVPFNSMIDSSNIVELDEEWLYNYPAFLLRDKPLTDTEVDSQITLLAEDTDSETDSETDIESANARPVVMKVANDKKREQGRSSHYKFTTDDRLAGVADIPKNKHLGKRDQRFEVHENLWSIENNDELLTMLRKPRRAEQAKKRLVWLPCANGETALVCYLTSPDEEKAAISEFFERHRHYDKFFSDDTTITLNTWESEFHLSFYQLIDTAAPAPAPAIPEPSQEPLGGKLNYQITRASVGFRFFGDFFDRFWTCHFVEYIPRVASDASAPTPALDFIDHSDKRRSWRQRKVLELLLLDRILTEAVNSTRKIYKTVRRELDVKSDGALTFSILTSDDYFASNKEWQKFEQVLQAVQDDLAGMLDTISKWESREKDREKERPRWTHKDESKYRGDIRKLVGQTSRKIHELKTYQSQVSSLKDTLASSQDKTRNDLSLLGAENIRFFTYVTVVFLPLGFAASIFSMSDPPKGSTVKPMAVCAIVALAVTGIAIVNAKALFAVAEALFAVFAMPSELVHKYSHEKMKRSYMVGQYTQRKNQRKKPRDIVEPMVHWYEQGKKSMVRWFEQRRNPCDDVEAAGVASTITSSSNAPSPAPRPPPSDVAGGDNVLDIDTSSSSSPHLGFWIAYVLIELPARRILLACYAMRKHKFTRAAVLLVVTGLLLLPLFVVSCMLQILVYNMFDILRLFWGCVVRFFSTPPPEEGDGFEKHMSMLTYPLRPYRPFKESPDHPGDPDLDQNPKPQSQNGENEKGAAGEVVTNDITDHY